MNAEIISVGTELLLGNITDTNATFLTQELAALGINCYWVSQVGDNLGRLGEALDRAWGRSDLTVVTGGLGPTEDDLTREAISTLLGETMAVQPALEAELRAFFASRNVPMPEANRKQATLIPSAQVLANPIGTAPGWWVERTTEAGPRRIVAMPGVPFEMRRMWRQEVTPRLVGLSGAALASRTLKVLGFGESAVEEQVRDLIHGSNPSVGTYAKADGIHLRLTARAADPAEALALIAPLEAAMSERLGDAIWGADEETLENVIGGLLAARGLRLVVLEAGGVTGGQVARLLTGATQHADRLFAAWALPALDAARLALLPGAPLLSPVPEPTPHTAGTLARALVARERDHVALLTWGDLPAGRDDERVQTTAHLAVARPGHPPHAIPAPQRAARSEIKRLTTLAALNLLRKSLLDAV